MSLPTREELVRRFRKVDDPEIEARRQHILQLLLEDSPQERELIEKGRLIEARDALRSVLARRQFVLAKDDDARIDACTDLTALKRWLDQAVTASGVADALA